MAVVLQSNRSEALLQLKRFDDAIAAANSALAIDPKHAKSQQRLERAQSGKDAAARKQAERRRAAEAQGSSGDGIEEFLTEGYIELQKKGGYSKR